MSDLVLGTAQWGSTYGITNRVGRLSDQTVATVAESALLSGITRVDTAMGYGDAERRLRPWAERFLVRTKISGAEPKRIPDLLSQSAESLGIGSVDGCLIHDWDALDSETQRESSIELIFAKATGLVSIVGASVYDENGIKSAIGKFGDELTLIQVPANPLDRRLDESQMLNDLNASGVIVQARSIFLQGLLIDPQKAQQHGHPSLIRFHKFAEENGLSGLECAMSHAKSLTWASEIVIGVTSRLELSEIVNSHRLATANRLPLSIATDDETLIDPRKWSRR